MKRALVPPNVKTMLLEKDVWSAPTPELHFCDPNYFSTADKFYGGGQRSKSIISEKLQKSRKKCQRSQFFLTFWLLSLPTSLRAITLLPVLDRIAQNKIETISKNCERVWLFSKSRFLTPPPPPPPPAKSFLTSIFGGYSLVDFSFP